MYQTREALYNDYSNSIHMQRTEASEVAAKMIHCATEEMEKSEFFCDLKHNRITKDAIHHVFGQFKFMRDNVHLLFSQNLSLIENADHPLINHIIFVLSKHQVDENQIREPHALMFHKFLLNLGMTEEQVQRLTLGDATKAYNSSYEKHRVQIVAEANSRKEASIMYFCYVIGREVSAAVRHSKLANYLKHLYPTRNFEFIQNHQVIEQEHADEESDLMLASCEHVGLSIETGLSYAYLATQTHFQWLDAVYTEYKRAS